MPDIEKLTVDGTSYDIADADARDDLETRAKVYYGTCSTAAATQTKVVTTSDDFELKDGVVLIVYFSIGNSARPIRLNVNGTGAKYVDQGGDLGDYVPNCTFDADSVCEFVYSSSYGWLWASRSASRSALCDTTLNTSNELNLVGNGVKYSGNDSTTATLSYNTAITMKGDTLTAGALKTTSGADLDTVNSGLTNGSVTKVGTSTVGGTAKPIYLSSGTPTALSGTAGGTAQPVYMSSGTIQACSSTVGSGTKPVYMSSGTITASSSTVGSGTKPVYMSSGTMTASSSTVGSAKIPTYLSSGTVTSCTTSYRVSSGDSITVRFWGGGYITSSGGAVHFTIPMSKCLDSGLSASVTSKGAATIRQSGSYRYGSSASAGTTSYTASVTPYEYIGLHMTLTFTSDLDATNNAVCGITLDATTVAFS